MAASVAYAKHHIRYKQLMQQTLVSTLARSFECQTCKLETQSLNPGSYFFYLQCTVPYSHVRKIHSLIKGENKVDLESASSSELGTTFLRSRTLPTMEIIKKSA